MDRGKGERDKGGRSAGRPTAAALADFNAPISPLAAVPYGLQHVLTMFAANLAPMMLICAAAGFGASTTTMMIQNALLAAGIGTFIQLYGIGPCGARMPLVMGVSIAFIALLSTITAEMGYGVAIGAVLIGGIAEALLGLCAKYWQPFVNHVVAGAVVTSIGFSLLKVGANSFGGGSGAKDFGSPENLLLGVISLIICLAFQVLAKDNLKPLSVLVGMISAYIIAIFMGKVDFSSFSGISAITLPKIMPFKPEFRLSAIISVTLLYIVSVTDTIGDTAAVAKAAFSREATDKEMRGSIVADGVTSSLSGILGCPPLDSFGQNVGLISMTHVANRRAIAVGAAILVAAGFVPAIGAFFASVPQSVLGGCTIMMFGSIMMSGIKMIADEGFTQRNLTIAGVSLSIGIGFTQVDGLFAYMPELIQTLFGGNSVALVFISALILNIILPGRPRASKN